MRKQEVPIVTQEIIDLFKEEIQNIKKGIRDYILKVLFPNLWNKIIKAAEEAIRKALEKRAN